MDELAKELEALGFSVDLSYRGQGVLVLRDFHIDAGRDAGTVVDVGFPASGYPDTPPSAVYIRPILDPPARGAVHASCPLGPAWVYWSRKIDDWPKDRSAKRIIRWLRSVFYYE